MVQLLINHQIVDVIKPGGKLPNGLEKLLEAKNNDGMTALLIASQKKNCALIEILIKDGASLKAVDKDGRTSIILAASSSDEDQVPTEKLSPEIFKVFLLIYCALTVKSNIFFESPFSSCINPLRRR